MSIDQTLEIFQKDFLIVFYKTTQWTEMEFIHANIVLLAAAVFPRIHTSSRTFSTRENTVDIFHPHYYTTFKRLDVYICGNYPQKIRYVMDAFLLNSTCIILIQAEVRFLDDNGS